MENMKRNQGIVYAMLSAVAFGLLPTFAIYAYRGGTNAITVVFLRFLFSAVFLFIYLKIKKVGIMLDKKVIPNMIFTGVVGYAATSLTLFLSYEYIAAGLSTILHFIYPAVVIFLSFIIFKEKLYARKVISLFLSLAGVYILIGFGSNKLHILGVLLALASGIFYSIYILQIGNSKIRNINSTVLTFYVSLFSSVGIFVFGLLTGTLKFHMESYSLIFIILIALTSIFGLIAFSVAVKIIGPSNTSILSTFEPITSIIMSAILFHESITINVLVGSAIIILSIYGIIKEPKKSKTKASLQNV